MHASLTHPDMDNDHFDSLNLSSMLVKISPVSEFHPCHPIPSMGNLLIIHLVNIFDIVVFIHVG